MLVLIKKDMKKNQYLFSMIHTIEENKECLRQTTFFFLFILFLANIDNLTNKNETGE